MLSPYNILQPYISQAIKDDVFIKDATGLIRGHNAIIDDNISRAKQGTITQPAYIADVDQDNYAYFDIKGIEITGNILQVNDGSGWVSVGAAGPFPKTSLLYGSKGKVIYVLFEIDPVIINKTLTGSVESDGHFMSKKYYDRLEFLYNARLGCTMVQNDEVIQSIDATTGEVVTDMGTYDTMYPKSIGYSVGDTVNKFEFIDKVCTLVSEPPYIKIVVKKDYRYIKNIFVFDSNKKFELID